MKKSSRLFSGILLIAGTSIGGGMLALPILTGQAGFLPSVLLYFASWLFMALTGLLFLEISFWMKANSNILTMAEKTLGPCGKVFAFCLYLFLFYCLTLAYIVGAGDLVLQLFSPFLQLPSWAGQIIFLALFGPFVYVGTRIVGRLNVFLVLGLALSYCIFIYLGAPHVNLENLKSSHWGYLATALPITFTAFAYQGIVPTLVEYMHRDVRKIRIAILVGSFLPFITYVIWQGLILGIVPLEGPGSLESTIAEGHNAVQPLKTIINAPSVYVVGQFFAFFALVTSFFGVTLGLLDFLADGLKIEKTAGSKLFLCLAIFLPPFFFAIVHPHVFLVALDYAGGFGCALLLGLLPILMVWAGRYQLKMKGEYKVMGGRPLLIALACFVFLELACEIFK
jgi:tyrosine-specific transport protein